jgi:hypothetical protein
MAAGGLITAEKSSRNTVGLLTAKRRRILDTASRDQITAKKRARIRDIASQDLAMAMRKSLDTVSSGLPMAKKTQTSPGIASLLTAMAKKSRDTASRDLLMAMRRRQNTGSHRDMARKGSTGTANPDLLMARKIPGKAMAELDTTATTTDPAMV